eukprot:scaffold610_cov169-Ochromonas_danica.AAC.3
MMMMTTENSRSAVSTKLRRAVDWKIFELSASLIEEDVPEEVLVESVTWFQQRHAQEVIEERQCQGACGFPLCTRPLPKTSSKAKYRISYNEKKIYEIEKSAYYCSNACLEKSELWISKLDVTLPYSRPAAKALLSQNTTTSVNNTTVDLPSSIDEVLDVLSGGGGGGSSSTASADTSSGSENSGLIPPPHPFVREDGYVEVKFENGKPVPLPVSTTTRGSGGSTQSSSTTPKEEVDVATIMETMKQLQVKYNLNQSSGKSEVKKNTTPSAAVKEEEVVVMNNQVEPASIISDKLNEEVAEKDTTKKKKRVVAWSLPEETSTNASGGSAVAVRKRPTAMRPVGLQVKERTDAQPMSVRAMATKKEPNPLSFIHRINAIYQPTMSSSSSTDPPQSAGGIAINPNESYGDIEGYVPKL